MRCHFIASLAVLFFILSKSILAYEIEEDVLYPAENSEATITILSTADRDLFAPIIKAFQKQNPQISVRYIIAASSEITKAVTKESGRFDLVVSSAMDLQTKLANDGFARPYQSVITADLPNWGKWRNSVFAFTQEPAAIVLSVKAFSDLNVPKTREALLEILRNQPERFRNRIATYDIRQSGLGYLFATQDSRISDTFWRFAEVMGNLGTQLYTGSSSMIDGVASGQIAVAYNVLGSYARARADVSDDIIIIEPEDYTTLMLRSALLTRNGSQMGGAEAFLDFLLELAWKRNDDESFLFPNTAVSEVEQSSKFRPIKLGPGLLVHLDALKRARFVKAWEASVIR